MSPEEYPGYGKITTVISVQPTRTILAYHLDYATLPAAVSLCHVHKTKPLGTNPTMNDEINYKNNPLHSISLSKMLVELTDHYGFDILFAYLNINCFKNNPSVASSMKFLKKTDWAREKVEAFYLYSFKNLPKASHQQYQLSPRDRIIPDDQSVGEPAELSLEDATRLREKREIRAAEFDSKPGSLNGKHSNAEQSNRPSSKQGSSSAHKDNNKSSASPDRTASTADNPWGLPRT